MQPLTLPQSLAAAAVVPRERVLVAVVWQVQQLAAPLVGPRPNLTCDVVLLLVLQMVWQQAWICAHLAILTQMIVNETQT